MSTYTIALIGDMLAATALDGDDAMMQERLEDTLSQINAEDRGDVEIVFHEGLTLYATEEEAEEAGADIVYSGNDMGWLEDAEGRSEYMAAARA